MSDTTAPRRLVARLGLLAALVAASSCGTQEAEVVALQGLVRTPSLEVAGVQLPDVGHGGTPFEMQAPKGELYLVYFGYTSCPDICPTTMSDMRVAIEALPAEQAERVTVAMATVDPERDTDEVITSYISHFFDDGIALRTTDLAAFEAAAGAFGVQWEIEAHAAGVTDYDVGHSAVTYVVDDTGTVVDEWPFGLETDAMTSDLKTLLREEQP
jgi:protein SCO1/2